MPYIPGAPPEPKEPSWWDSFMASSLGAFGTAAGGGLGTLLFGPGPGTAAGMAAGGALGNAGAREYQPQAPDTARYERMMAMQNRPQAHASRDPFTAPNYQGASQSAPPGWTPGNIDLYAPPPQPQMPSASGPMSLVGGGQYLPPAQMQQQPWWDQAPMSNFWGW